MELPRQYTINLVNQPGSESADIAALSGFLDSLAELVVSNPSTAQITHKHMPRNLTAPYSLQVAYMLVVTAVLIFSDFEVTGEDAFDIASDLFDIELG